MNINEAKTILLLYRPGTADAEDPQVAAALALTKTDAELACWFEQHCARQTALCAKFRQVGAPAGLKEQIISEQLAEIRLNARRKERITAAVALSVTFAALIFIVISLAPHFSGADRSLGAYQNQMANTATSGYGMSLLTNDLTQIRTYLAQSGAPADYTLPPALEKIPVAGCAIESWSDKKVSMICFRTNPALAANQSDLWLFVVDRKSVKHIPETSVLQFAQSGPLYTAAWTQGDKLYVLGTRGDEATIRKFL
ncbi:MAG TPA: hypothetical protein VGO57_10015 [Verrucomicrobiae bacterium]